MKIFKRIFQQFRQSPRHRIVPAVALALACAGCSGHSGFSLPLQNVPGFSVFTGSETESKTKTTPAAPAYDMPDRWWRAFDSDQLNTHIRAGLENNFTLAAAWQRLRAARALARRERSALYPDLDLGLSGMGELDDDGGDEGETYEFGPAASYEVDLWGRIRSAAQAEALRAESQQYAYRTAALSLSADIALTWTRLVEAHNQQALLNRQIATNQQVLEVLKARFGAGQVRSRDILRQKLLIESLREDVIALQSRIGVLEHQMAALEGRPPQGAAYDIDRALPVLPTRPETGLPAGLIRRRPDVKQAELEIAAADKDLAAAVRNQYPRLTLSASYASDADAASELFSNWVATLAGNMIAPVIDGGQRRAEVERRQALRDLLVNEYGQVVLDAFREVEDALVREEKQNARLANLQNRLEIAKNTVDQVRTGYFNGANEYIAVLSAIDEKQEIERDLINARANLIEFRIALYRALAGGFDPPRENGGTTGTNNDKQKMEPET